MFLGIDGGGSKTRFVLCNREGELCGDWTGPSASYLSVGFEGLAEVLGQGKTEILRQAGANEVELAVVGVPSYGEIGQDIEPLEATVAKALQFPYLCVNDVKLAWAGALACQLGIVILAGTGSMAYAVDGQHKDIRSGGWGHYFGDEGSAYWLGLQCCQLFSKMADGRLPRGPLYDILQQHLQLQDDFGILNLFVSHTEQTAQGNQRSKIAQLAKLLYRAATNGDDAAQQVFAQAAHELALLVVAIVPRFQGGSSPLKLSYTGGVFAARDYFVPMLETALQKVWTENLAEEHKGKAFVLQDPQLSPALGACLYGAIQCGLVQEAYSALLAQCPSLQ